MSKRQAEKVFVLAERVSSASNFTPFWTTKQICISIVAYSKKHTFAMKKKLLSTLSSNSIYLAFASLNMTINSDKCAYVCAIVSNTCKT